MGEPKIVVVDYHKGNLSSVGRGLARAGAAACTSDDPEQIRNADGLVIPGAKKVTKKNVWWLFDRMIPAVAVVCMCIRFGNLMNSEIFGFPTTLPWGFEFVRSREWQALYNQNGESHWR